MTIIRVIVFVTGLLIAPGLISAATRYVSPTGSGSTCSSGSPCSVTTGMTATVAGDTLILKDGDYTTTYFPATSSQAAVLATVNNGTVSNRITVMAENRHGAILKPQNAINGIQVRHDYYTFKGIKIDGQSNNKYGVYIFDTKSNVTFGTIIEDVWTFNTGNVSMFVQNAEQTIVRFSKFQNVGMDSTECCGEGLYTGSADNDPGRHVDGLEAYGNTWINAISNMTDFKVNVQNVFVHHSIFEDFQNTIQHDQGAVGNEGIFHSFGTNGSSNNRIEDVIVRNSSPTSVTRGVHATSGVSLAVRNSVFYNITGISTAFLSGRNGSTLTTSGLTACNLNRYNIEGSVSQSGNSLNVAQSNCDAEEARILAEMALLPGNPDPPSGQEEDQDPILILEFNEGTGTAAADTSGTGNNATLINGAGWTTACNSGAVLLAEPDDHVKVLTTSMNAAKGTIAFLFRPTSFPSSTHYLIGHTSQPAFNDRIQLYYDDTGGNLDVGLGDTHAKHLGIFDLAIDTCYHIALTWNNGTYFIYVDGSQVATGSYTSLGSLGSYWHIGNNGDDGASAQIGPGAYSILKAWNRSLSAGEILADFEGLPIPPGTPRSLTIGAGSSIRLGAGETITTGQQ